MPYITQEDRPQYEKVLGELIGLLKEKPPESVDGHLNYVVTRVIKEVYPLRYYHINKAMGKVMYTTFSAFTSGNTFLSVDNTYAIPIMYPKNLVVHHFPNASLNTIFQQLLHLLQKNRETPKILSLKSLLTIGTKIRRFSLEQGLKQKLLYTKWKGNPAVTTCYQHPVHVAVRTCAVCHMHLCEACYESFQDRYYCKKLSAGGR